MVAQVDSAHYGRISSLYYHMSDATYQDVADARLVMEPVSARLIAEKQDPDNIETLRAYVAAHSADDPGEDTYEAYVDEAAGFHKLVMGMAGNPVLSLAAESLQDVLLGRTQSLFPIEEQGRVHHDHMMIAKAMIKGEAGRAERLMREHMQEYVNYSLQRYPGVLAETVDWR